MINIVSCMKSRDSCNRIIRQFSNENVQWEEFIEEIDDLQQKIIYTEYDFAIIDEKIWWKNEAVELLTKKDVKIIYFQGDFSEIIEALNKLVPEEIKNDISEGNNTLGEDTVNLMSEEEVLDSSTLQKEKETVKYITQKVEVAVPVYKSIYTGINNSLIMVANLSKRAGSTFITLNLAKHLSNLNIFASVIEPPIDKPYIFDAIGLENRLEKKEQKSSLKFYSYPHEILQNEKFIRDRETIEDGIAWIIPDSRKNLIKSSEWDYYKMMKLIYASKKSNINIIDCGDNLMHESIKPILSEVDLLLIVIDPMPVEVMQNDFKLEMLKELKKNGVKIEFIINRFNLGVDKEQLVNFLNIKPLVYIPALSSEYVYKSIYECNIPYSKELEKPLNDVVKKFIPNEFIKNDNKKSLDKKSKINMLINLVKRGGKS